MPTPAALARVIIAGLAGSLFAVAPALAQAAPDTPSRNAQPRPRDQGNQDGARQNRGPGGFGGFGGRFGNAGITDADLKSYAAILNLDKSQMEAAKLLLEAHQQELDAQQDAARDKMDTARREAREAQDPAAFGKMAAQMQTFRAERQKLEDRFLSDLKETLTPEQAAKWPIVEQTRRREKTMPRGLIAGERVDVIKQVERLKLDDKTKSELKPMLEQYAQELDKELITRNTLADAAQAGAGEAFANMDAAKITKTWEDARAASMRVRDVNRKYARQIEPLLPEDQREAFVEAARRESYPTVYRPTLASRSFDRVSRIGDLSTEQKDTLKTLRENFDRELSALQKQMEAAHDQREASIKPSEVIATMSRGGGGGGGGGRGLAGLMDTEQMRDLRDKRQTLERSTVEKVRAMLTPEQREKILDNEDDDRGDRDDTDRPRRQRNQDRQPRQRRNDTPSQQS
jgi:hypothetical protein